MVKTRARQPGQAYRRCQAHGAHGACRSRQPSSLSRESLCASREGPGRGPRWARRHFPQTAGQSESEAGALSDCALQVKSGGWVKRWSSAGQTRSGLYASPLQACGLAESRAFQNAQVPGCPPGTLLGLPVAGKSRHRPPLL